MTKHTFDLCAMTAAALVTVVCFALPAQWPVVLVWAAIALYFGSEVILRGKA